jgi:hypothetical protein
MQVSAGVAYDYFFKDHTRYFFSWLKLTAKGVRCWGCLSESALSVSKNISKVATFCQYGGDIPYAFQSLKEVCTGASDQSPRWLEACRFANYVAFIVGVIKSHIFNQPSSILDETIESVTDLIVSGHGLYQFISNRHEEAPSLENKHVTHPWDAPKIVLFVQKVSSFVLVGLALFSLYKGEVEYAPNLTLFFTTTSLSSHFLYHYEKAVSKLKK